MSERIEISFSPAEGAVLRMLGLVERRGFVVRGIVMASTTDRGSLAIEVEPRDPGRRVDVMARQLQRLLEVEAVAISSRHSGPLA